MEIEPNTQRDSSTSSSSSDEEKTSLESKCVANRLTFLERRRKQEEIICPRVPIRPITGRAADWDDFLQLPESIDNLKYIAGVKLFKRAPLLDIWDELTHKDMVFEVPNIFAPQSPRPIYWYGSIFIFAGYKCLIEYDNLDIDNRFYTWASFCSDVLKPFRYSSKQKILLYPPFDASSNGYNKPKFCLEGFNRGIGRPTIAENHAKMIADSIKNKRKYPVGTIVEAIDTELFSVTRLAKVIAWVGDRMKVRFGLDDEFMCTQYSELVYPIGWSRTVGHDTFGIPPEFEPSLLQPSYFPFYPSNVRVKVGQFLEVRHPGKPHQIVAAKIQKLLKHGYFYVKITTTQVEEQKPIIFAFHLMSPYIFPTGFCKSNDIELIPPFGENVKTFSWSRYLSRWNYNSAPLEQLPQRATPEFVVGMKLEAVDEVSPVHLGPATIISIKAHLLRIHFDGWTTRGNVQAEHWIDFESPNIYPAGYAEMVNHGFYGCTESVEEIVSKFKIKLGSDKIREKTK